MMLKDFAGQTVLILGMGNRAFETAKHIYGQTNYVHLVGRSKLRFSWDTQYVGDLRGVNVEVADSYQLKALEGFTFADMRGAYVNRRDDGRLQLRSGELAEFQRVDFNGGRHGYDRVISCFGFKFDTTLFANNSLPTGWKEQVGEGSGESAEKYPSMDQDFQSTDFEHLYYAGTAAHALDFKRSAGGFIHGFRYTARALHRLLENKYHGNVWPHIRRPIHQLVNIILKSVYENSGIYQMVIFLSNVAIINRNTGNFDFIEEFPLELLPRFRESTGQRFNPEEHLLAVLTLQYGKNFSTHEYYKFGTEATSGGPLSSQQPTAPGHPPLSPAAHSFVNRALLPSNRTALEADMDARRAKDWLPQADGVVHVISDLVLLFEGVESHVMPLRKFFEFFLERDLRAWPTSHCKDVRLTTELVADAPTHCQRLFAKQQSVLQF